MAWGVAQPRMVTVQGIKTRALATDFFSFWPRGAMPPRSADRDIYGGQEQAQFALSDWPWPRSSQK